jgi:hypothetical protein
LQQQPLVAEQLKLVLAVVLLQRRVPAVLVKTPQLYRTQLSLYPALQQQQLADGPLKLLQLQPLLAIPPASLILQGMALTP